MNKFASYRFKLNLSKIHFKEWKVICKTSFDWLISILNRIIEMFPPQGGDEVESHVYGLLILLALFLTNILCINNKVYISFLIKFHKILRLLKNIQKCIFTLLHKILIFASSDIFIKSSKMSHKNLNTFQLWWPITCKFVHLSFIKITIYLCFWHKMLPIKYTYKCQKVYYYKYTKIQPFIKQHYLQ
jgi:hypothetical protein